MRNKMEESHGGFSYHLATVFHKFSAMNRYLMKPFEMQTKHYELADSQTEQAWLSFSSGCQLGCLQLR